MFCAEAEHISKTRNFMFIKSSTVAFLIGAKFHLLLPKGSLLHSFVWKKYLLRTYYVQRTALKAVRDLKSIKFPL